MPHISTIDRTEYQNSVVLQLRGDFDMSLVDELRTSILEALDTSPYLLLDLRGTHFLDSICLGAIIGGRNRARRANGWVRLVGPTGDVAKVLRITGLDEVLGVFPDLQAAGAVPQQRLSV